MYVKRGIQNHFKIPIAVCDQILPSETISIQKMLDFTLPSPASAIVANNPSSFFSHNAPESVTDAMFTRMRRLPIPPASVVGKLVELGHQAWLDGYQSV